ncbi:DUF427 domain-containing protein [Streptomyces sp. bgisy100]|uniref:DUF427 domain-containing protein n=1 Tax=Streptomyces sp. bgisy100 TaxID=3413783 RepID=UPI003D752E80
MTIRTDTIRKSGALHWEPSERWVRGTKGGTTVVDSRHPVLVWQPDLPVPCYTFPGSEVRTDLLRDARRPDTGAHCGATVFYDLHLDGAVTANAAWTFPGEDLAGHISFEWFGREVLDHWYEEDEEIFVHPRDPHARVDPLPSSRHVRVEIDGVPVAETRRPVLLFETGLPVRYYIPREDVRFDLLTPTDHRTRCPYKGVARYWSWSRGGPGLTDVAWTYPEPVVAAGAVRDLVCFYNEAVDLVVDGERLERPVTVFSGRRP